MRQALFAVMLVAASFAGGAVVNGPGLRWAQNMVLGRMGLEEDGDADKEKHVGGGLDDGVPFHAIPPLAVEPSVIAPGPAVIEPKARADDAAAAVEPGALPGLPPVPETATADTAAPPTRPPIQTPAPALVPAPAVVESPAPLTTSRERDRAALDLASATSAPERDSGRGDTTIRPVSLASAADVPSTAPPQDAAKGEPTDWAGVRKALRDLGVSRYGTDGAPIGRVRFHCVIPLAGRRAVGQHFEAEGDDDLEAARAALRRVVLWRAAEGPKHTP